MSKLIVLTIAIVITLLLSKPNITLALDQEVIAIVNGEAITSLDITNRTNTILRLRDITATQETMADINQQILHILIDEKLISGAAKKKNIILTDVELENLVESVAEQNSMKKSDFINFLKTKKISYDAFIEHMKNELLWMKIVKSEIEPEINVSEEEISEEQKLTSNSTSNFMQLIQLAEIVIYADSENQTTAESLSEKLLYEIKRGANFENLAKSFSQSSSAKNGGIIGWVSMQQLDAELIQAVSKLKTIGEVTPPIRTKDNCIIILKLLGKQNKEVESPNRDIGSLLYQRKLNLKIRAYMSNLKNNAFIEIKGYKFK